MPARTARHSARTRAGLQPALSCKCLLFVDKLLWCCMFICYTARVFLTLVQALAEVSGKYAAALQAEKKASALLNRSGLQPVTATVELVWLTV